MSEERERLIIARSRARALFKVASDLATLAQDDYIKKCVDLDAYDAAHPEEAAND